MASKKRLATAAVAAALVMFVWGGLAHMVLMRGVGFSHLPDEARTVEALEATVETDGLYYFPEQERRGATGFIVYHPRGSDSPPASKLLIQLASNLLAGVLAPFVASRARGSYLARVLIVASIGAGGLATISTIYWNWYGYPHAFFIAQVVDQLVAWTLGGAVAAGILREAGTVAPLG